MKNLKQNKIPTFIEQFKISPKLCDDMVTYFNSNKTRHAVGEVGEHHVVKDIKDSIDLCCTPKDNIYPLRDFYLAINKCMLQYQEIYPELKSHYSFDFTANYNIQYYPKGGGFKDWHNERMSPAVNNRILVFMTYLNDVPNAGTEFKYQKFKSKAKKGLTLIWPPDFTHTHRGIVTEKHEKIIATGWIDFLPQNQ